jgi:TPR repeat protein
MRPEVEFQQLVERAQAGDAEAQLELGQRYATGTGVPQDDVQAAAWYRSAAEGGDTEAMVALGRCYVEGKGVARDLVEGGRWYRRATEDWRE